MLRCPRCKGSGKFVAFDCAVIVDEEKEMLEYRHNTAEYPPGLNITQEPLEFYCTECGTEAEEKLE